MADATSVNWGLTALAGVLTVGRYTIRLLTASRKLYWDDAVHGLAFVALIIHGATNQVTADAKAQVKADVALKGLHAVPPAQLLDEYYHLYVLNTVNNIFLYATFWLVKFAFLLCYRQLFFTSSSTSSGGFTSLFKRAWWAVTALTFVSFWVPFGGVIASCNHGASSNSLADYKACNSSDNNAQRTAKLIYTCVLNVVTDVLIMALPLGMLPRLRITTRQRLGLALVFSVALLCVALDLLRTVEAVAGNQALYTVLEINFVVVVSCLPSYKSLLTARSRSIRERKASQGYCASGSSGASGGASAAAAAASWSRRAARKQSTTLVEYCDDDVVVPMKSVIHVESRSLSEEESAAPDWRNHERSELPAHEPAATNLGVYR